MQNEREFLGIWVPKEIWLNKEMSVKQKIRWIENASGNKTGGKTK